MGKSYKKNPVLKILEGKSKYAKRAANKKVRKQEEVGNGSIYKKYSNSYNIFDYSSRWTKEDAIKRYNDLCRPEFYSHCGLGKEYGYKCVENVKKRYPTLESYLQYWEKCVRRK